ncbi:hypothetical protein Pelo_9437 [Pelomyxa schiedti]|nr:hypothetical protein Pelo_9437 [Pelomyxa schiedti]
MKGRGAPSATVSTSSTSTSNSSASATVTAADGMTHTLTSFSPNETVESFINEGKMVLKLVGNMQGLADMREASPTAGTSAAVALYGSTHCGKSALVRSLLGHPPHRRGRGGGGGGGGAAAEEEEEGGSGGGGLPRVADDLVDDFCPTSANTSFYDDAESGIRYLDVEGCSGGNKMPKDETLASEGLTRQYYVMRRASIKEHMPRLAYCCCDVVIFISPNDFSNYDTYVEEVQQAACVAATKDVHDAIKPCCILVQNRAPVQKCRASNFEALTAAFFRDTDPDGDLLKAYGMVKCVRIPDWNESAEFFDSQITKLKEVIKEMLSHQKRLRIERGLDYSLSTWSTLFSMVVNRFSSSKGLWIAAIMQEILNFDSPEPVQKALAFYNQLHLRDFTERFLASIRMLACWTAWETFSKAAFNEDFKRNLWSPVVAEERLKAIKVKVLDKFITEMEWNKPCRCITTYERQPLQCEVIKRIHGDMHISFSVQGHQGLFRWIKRLVCDPKPIHWNGAYMPIPIDNDKLCREFFSVYKKLDKPEIQESQLVLAAVEIIQGSCHTEGTFIGFTFPESLCTICLSNAASFEIGCHHYFCNKCIDLFRMNDNRLTGACNAILGVYMETIRPSFCPVCLGAATCSQRGDIPGSRYYEERIAWGSS